MAANEDGKRFAGPLGLLVSHSPRFVIAVGLATSVLGAFLTHSIVRRDEARRFEMAQQEVVGLVRSRFDRFLGLLQHTRAFLTTKERMSRQDFRLFVESTELRRAYPELLGLAFVDRISTAFRHAHEREVREDGYARYRVWPKRTGSTYLYPIKFLEPSEGNLPALGFDTYSDPARAAALDRARDTGSASLSAPLQLSQEIREGDAHSFVLLLPVYKRGWRARDARERKWALQGYLSAAFRGADFFTELVRSGGIFREGVGLRAIEAETGIALTPSGLTAAPARGALEARQRLELYGRAWDLEMYTTPGFASSADRYAPWFVLLFGFLVTFLLGGLVFLLGRHAASQRSRALLEQNARERLQQLAIDLQAAARDRERSLEQAREAVEMRDDFLSICSHELRTPLTSMKLQNQLVQRTLEADLAAGNITRFRKMVQQSERQIDRLTRLVEEMLDISRIRSGKLSITPEKLDLVLLVRETIDRFGPQLQAAGCRLDVKAPPSLTGRWDRLRMEQVVTNLLSNALKYGAGKPIHVEVAREGGRAVLAVRDEGLGIAPEHQARIFERFERAVAKVEISGLGLGLFIVRQILELHGGTIRVESAVGQGSRFVVELPLEAATRISNELNASPFTPAVSTLENP